MKNIIWQFRFQLQNDIVIKNFIIIKKTVFKMSLIIKPLAAQITKGNDLIFFKKSPYLTAQVSDTIYQTSTDTRGGKTPQWSETFNFTQLGPLLRITLLDRPPIGKVNIIGQGQFNLAPAYAHPYMPENKYIDILKNGNLVAKVLCRIEYQGNAFNNNTNQGENYHNMTSMILSGIKEISQQNSINNMNLNQSNISNNGWGDNGWNDNRGSYNQNMNPNQNQNMNSEIKTIPVPVPVPIAITVPVIQQRRPTIIQTRVPLCTTVINTSTIRQPIITTTTTTYRKL